MTYIRAYYRELIGTLFICILLANVLVFVSSMKLSSEINQYEIQTNALTQENMQLEKQLADDMSFKTVQTYEQAWGFKQATSPVYVGQLQFALNSAHN